MLSPESAAVVRATLPAVGGALDEITTRFYGTMFSEQPQLLDGLFNRGNQANGEQRRALAGSIAHFAQALLANPDARPDALLDRIAHKHAALGVTEDQYTVVHTYLFRAIAEVLGDAVTPEVAAAWDEVYWLMAGALIAREARLYQEAGMDPRHPWRQWTVIERREETPTSCPSCCTRPTTPPCRPPGRAVRQRAGPVARRSAPGAPVQPLRRPRQPDTTHHRQARRERGRGTRGRSLQPPAPHPPGR